MKPLAGLVVLAALAASASAQLTPKEQKEKFKKQRPDVESAPSTPPAGATAPPRTNGIGIADLEVLLLRSPECKKNPDDTAKIAADLKGKYGIISCRSEIDGLTQILLVPKSDANPDQQLRYASVQGYKLLRARIVDHYLVLQFDKQTQYLDLLKQDKDLYGKETGFALAGFVADENLSRFEDMRIFKDAFVEYASEAADSAMLAKLPALVTNVVGSKRHRLQAAKAKGAWIVTVTSEGNVTMVWPEKKRP